MPENQPPWAEEADLLEVVEATHHVLDEIGFAGLAVTPETCRLDLYWVGAPPGEVAALVRQDPRVVVHDDAAHDHTELARAAEALSPGSRLGAFRGGEGHHCGHSARGA